MTLKTKLYLSSISLHVFLLVCALVFSETLQGYLLLIELVLIVSLSLFIWLINKGLQPLEYVETFSNLLREQEFNSRFSPLNQPDLDKLIDQFNQMLARLYQERLALGEQRGIFQQLMAESPIGVVLLDFEGKISEVNPAAERLLDIEKQNIIAKPLSIMSENMLASFNMVSPGQEKVFNNSRGQRLRIGHFQLYDRGFHRSFYMVTELTGDIIKAQKLAYEKLIRLMSHEVNNTIAITQSLLESCLCFKEQLNEGDKQEYQEAITLVINRGKSLDSFMRSYAEVVKLPPPVKVKYNLSQQLENLSKLFYAECNKRDIELKTRIQRDVFVHADAHLLEQALVNVIKNAIEAIGHSGTIELVLSQQHDEFKLSVIDTGIGLSEESTANLFTPFYTSKKSGQGVGLMLVSEVLSAHNISFALVNNVLGRGAMFDMTINSAESATPER